MNFWKPSLSFPFSALLGGSGFHTAPSNGLAVNPELPFSPFLLNLFHLHSLPTQCAWAAGESWRCVLPVPLNIHRRELPQTGHLCGRLQMPPLELRKRMLVASQVATAKRRETAAQAQPAPVAHTEEIFLNYLWSILVGTVSERSSQVHILSSNTMAEEDSLVLVWKQTGYGCDSFVFCEFPLGAASAGACVEVGRVGICSSRISCGDCWGGQCVQGAPSHSRFIPPHVQVCLLCSQSPLDGRFPCGSMPMAECCGCSHPSEH